MSKKAAYGVLFWNAKKSEGDIDFGPDFEALDHTMRLDFLDDIIAVVKEKYDAIQEKSRKTNPPNMQG